MKKYKQVNDKVELCISPELEPELKKYLKMKWNLVSGGNWKMGGCIMFLP